MTYISTFEDTVRMAKATSDYSPLWQVFANTDFFVVILPQAGGGQTQNFRFVLREGPNSEPTIIISEELSRLNPQPTDKAIKIRGAQLVSMLDPTVGILIGLSNGGFGMTVEMVRRLRASIKVA